MPQRFGSLLSDRDQQTEDHRRAALCQIIRGNAALMSILAAVKSLDLPDAWLVSGSIYQTVWNHLTSRPSDHGIKDYDVLYFDGSDLSYEAEDRQIKRLESVLPDLAPLLELRNQARVHLWYEKKFGNPYPPLRGSIEALERYAAKTHAVAVRLLSNGELDIRAPFGLANIFSMILVPNHGLDNSKTYQSKGRRMKSLWPELTLIPWGDNDLV
ncbi:nucleotidyltransferase family protein [Roseibium sp.]|uniref:nucleotidyltransferase family protein n=1 Tax=Roseibium sp. TaxID=1936156 RepID=UPI003A985728